MNLEPKAFLLQQDGIYTMTGSGTLKKISEDYIPQKIILGIKLFLCILHNGYISPQTCELRRNLKPEQIDFLQLSHGCEYCKNGMALPYHQTRCTKLRTCRNCGPLPSNAFRKGTSGDRYYLCNKCLAESENRRATNAELRKQRRPCKKCNNMKNPDEMRTLHVCKQCYSDARNQAQIRQREREKAGLPRLKKRRGKYA